jgi:Uma2 family endonuclease
MSDPPSTVWQTNKNLPAAPVLAVEVLSYQPVNRSQPQARPYEPMRTPSYWVLDPDVPDLLVLELDAHGLHQEVVRVVATMSSRHAGRSRVVPSELLRRLRSR